MSLLTSLSPHRILNRFSRPKEPTAAAEETREPDSEKTPFASFGLPKQKLMGSALDHLDHSLDLLSHTALDSADHTASDLVATSESVDLWSLGSDSHHNATTMTTVHENTSTDEFYYSPTEFLTAEPESHLHSSPALEAAPQKTPSRKRKLSRVNVSPSEAVAAQIDKLTVPRTPAATKALSASKTWTPALDSALLLCQERYKDYRRKHSPDGTTTKHALRNKILSRLLFNTTGVNRTAKQISSRLIRLSKATSTKDVISPSYSAQSVPEMEDSHAIFSSPVSVASTGFPDKNAPLLSIREFSVAFDYKHQIQGSHFFTKLVRSSTIDRGVGIDRARKATGIDNNLFDHDFLQLAHKLVAQNVPIFNVTASMDLRPSDNITSTPTSPLTNPHLFTLDNGSFLTYMNVGVSGKKCKDLFISWKSAITIYKGKSSRLLETRELVNGYKNDDGDFTLEVPFLNNFWSGYLTFLTNGSNRFEELKSLYILQVIYDGDDQEMTNIHGVFTYSFDIAASGHGSASVSTIVLKGGEETEMDDNATVLASSSPVRSSPGRFNFSIDTNLANRNASPGPSSVPTYDANLLYKLNPNYSQAPVRPTLSRFSSVPHHSQTKTGFENYVNLAPSYSSTDLLAPPSAGQNGVVPALPHASPYNQPLHALQSIQYSSTSLASDGQYHACTPPFQYLESAPIGEVGQSGMALRPNHAASQWHAPIHDNGSVPVAVTSAPASQVHFFPGGNFPTAKEATKQTITFGPILEYDPSKSHRGQPKRSKCNPSIHKFQLTRQIMYKPKKDS